MFYEGVWCTVFDGCDEALVGCFLVLDAGFVVDVVTREFRVGELGGESFLEEDDLG